MTAMDEVPGPDSYDKAQELLVGMWLDPAVASWQASKAAAFASLAVVEQLAAFLAPLTALGRAAEIQSHPARSVAVTAPQALTELGAVAETSRAELLARINTRCSYVYGQEGGAAAALANEILEMIALWPPQ